MKDNVGDLTGNFKVLYNTYHDSYLIDASFDIPPLQSLNMAVSEFKPNNSEYD